LDEFCWNIAAIMPEHNIVVFAGDHCGPEVNDRPPPKSPAFDSGRQEADFDQLTGYY
jgi:hypothetical protein